MSILEPFLKLSNYANKLNEKYAAMPIGELRALTLAERIRFYNWTFEIWALALLAAVYGAYVIGTRLNSRRATQLFDSLTDGFQKLAFAKVGFSTKAGEKKQYVAEQNNTWYTTFATGRSSIESITARAHMTARYNPLTLLMERVVGLFFPSLFEKDLGEFLEVSIVPNGFYVTSPNADLPKEDAVTAILSRFKFIASIVNKSVMTKARETNYFLSLTHTSESEKLPVEYVFMSESNQLNGFFEHYAGPEFKDLLAKCSRFLSFVSFTDLPEEKPITDKLWNLKQKPRCVIHCEFVTGTKDLNLLNQLIAEIVKIFDAVTQDYAQNPTKAFLTNDMLKKASNLRSQELQKIVKVMKQVERELAQEKKQDVEREKRRQMRSKLSGQEQDKIEQKMREKRERRMRNRQKVRM